MDVGHSAPTTRRSQQGGLLHVLSQYRPHKQPRLTAGLLLWFFGLLVLLSPAPSAVTPEKLERFEGLLKQAEGDVAARKLAEDLLSEAYWDTEDAKVWFWRFRAEHRQTVYQRMAVQQERQKVVDAMNRDRDRLVSSAKASLGLWSDAGVGETRRMFWRSFEAGKVFGRRQSLWDLVMLCLGSRERNALGLLLQGLITTLINFTIGMVTSVFVYALRMPSLIIEYQAGLLSGLGFFFLSLLGAVSAVLAFLAALYGTSAVSLFALSSVLNAQNRIQHGAGRNGQHPYLRQHME